MSEQYTLYGGDISYYTGDVYKNVILPSVGWPVIPVVATPDKKVLQDTSDIIDALEEQFPQSPITPQSPKQKVVALLMEVYGDEWLKLPAMHYRWNHNLDWIVGEFGKLSAPHLDEAGQREVGEQTCRPFRGSLPMLGVTEKTFAAVESSYEALLLELDAHFAVHDFMFGSRPSIGDYGLIGPLYAHQYRDPNSGALMQRISPNVARWVTRMMEPAPLSGEFLANDEVPDTLLPVLARMMREQVPVIHSTMDALAAWAVQNPGEVEVPRSIGMHKFTLEAGGANEASEQRAIQPFVLWMWQRPLDAFNKLDAQQQGAVRALLGKAGAEDALQKNPEVRVRRHNYKLEVER